MNEHVMWLLLGRMYKSDRLWRPMLVPSIVAMTFTAFLVAMCGFALSGEQVATRDLGRADHRLGTAITPGAQTGEASVQKALLRRLRAEYVADPRLEIQSFDVRPDSIPRPLTTGRSRVVQFREGESLHAQYPGARLLESGDWPSVAGEVAISNALRDRLISEGDLKNGEFEVFSGLDSLKVTGSYANIYAEDGYEILAGSGTWSAMPGRKIADRFVGTGAILNVYWRGDAETVDVAGTLSEAVPGSPPVAALLTSEQTRAVLVSDDDLSVLDVADFAFLAPFLVLTLFSMGMAGRSVLTWVRRVVDTCVALGLRRGSTVAVLSALATLAALISWGLGTGVGILVGLALRALLVPLVLDHPLGPIRGLTPLLTAGVGASVVVAATCASLLRTRTHGGRLWTIASSAAGQTPWSLLRRVAATVLIIRTLSATASQGTDVQEAGPIIAQMMLAVLLLVPDLVATAIRLVPGTTPRGLVTKRLMQADRIKFSLMAIVIAVSVAAPTAAATFVATTTRTQEAGNMSQVPVGQLWVDRSEGPAAARASEVAQNLLDRNPLSLGLTLAFTEGDPTNPAGNQTLVGTLSTPQSLKDVVGKAATPAAQNVLSSGGVVLISGKSQDRHVQIQRGTAQPRDLNVPFTHIKGAPPEMSAAFAGFMLVSTASQLEIAIAPRLDVFARVRDEDTTQVITGLRDQGMDAHSVQFHVVPEPTEPTAEWFSALVGLVSISVLLLGSMMTAHSSSLRECGARLAAVGLSRRVTRGIAVTEFGAIFLAAGLASAVSSVSAIAILASSASPRLILDIPWGFILFTVTAIMVSSGALLYATLRASTLSPQSRALT